MNMDCGEGVVARSELPPSTSELTRRPAVDERGTEGMGAELGRVDDISTGQ